MEKRIRKAFRDRRATEEERVSEIAHLLALARFRALQKRVGEEEPPEDKAV